jgi:topoisomerase IV subunit A
LVVHELPPGTSARKVLEEIDAITNPQPKAGKKSLTPEQTREKQLVLSMLDTGGRSVRDESDRTHPVRLVFEPRTSKIDETEFVNLLLAKTSLETNAPINLVMVGLDGRPTGKDLREIVSEWIKFRFTTVTRRTQHKLNQVLDRIHVLEGRMLVLLNVDKVIRIIRNADDPKAALLKAFKLTERQAEDILEMRLRMLAKLEHIKVEQELDEKRKEQKGLEKILASRKVLEDLVVSEIEADVNTFGDKRRTKIEEAEKAEIETPVIDEPVTVIFSRKGWVRARQGWGVDATTLSFKEGDELLTLIPCRTVDPVVFLDSKGRAYTVQAGELPPGRGDGAPASSLVDVQEGAHIMYVVGGKPETSVLVASTGGYGFCSKIADMMSTRRAGREFMSIEEGEAPVQPFMYESAERNYVATISADGRMLLFPLVDLKYMSKGRGMVLMGLEKEEKLVAVAVSDQPSLSVSGITRGREKEVELADKKLWHYAGHRARMGRVLPDKLKPVALKVQPKPGEPEASN